MTTIERIWTGEDLLRLGPDEPCELVNGRLVTMAPPGGAHGGSMTKVGRYLDEFVEDRDLGWVLSGDSGFYTSRNPDTVRGPDVAFYSQARLPGGLPRGYLTVAPELAVEIASPSNSETEIADKLVEYFAAGVEQVWVIDPIARTIDIYATPTSVRRLDEHGILEGDGALAGFVLPVNRFFPRR